MNIGDLVVIYSTLIRSCIEYDSPAWSALTKNQSDVIELIQKRASRIIIPSMLYLTHCKDNSEKQLLVLINACKLLTMHYHVTRCICCN